MSNRLRYNSEKTFQAMGILLELIPEKTESYMRLLKLLYMADRLALAQIGRTITGDRVYAMDNGPALSRTYDTIKGSDPKSPEWTEYFQRMNYKVKLVKNPGNGELSRFEIELLNKVSEDHQALDDWDLVEETHEFEEWKKNFAGEGTSTLIPLEDILAAVGQSEHMETVLKKQQEEDYFDRLFGGDPDAMVGR
jgi:uncharacterized phage-associated protein